MDPQWDVPQTVCLQQGVEVLMLKEVLEPPTRWTSGGFDNSSWERNVAQVRRPGDWSCHDCKLPDLV